MVVVTLAFNLLLDTKTAHDILGDTYCIGNLKTRIVEIEATDGAIYPITESVHPCVIGKGESLGKYPHGAGWHFSFMHWFIVLVNIFLLILRAVHLNTWYNKKSEK